MHYTHPTRTLAHTTRGTGLIEAIIVASIVSTAFAALLAALVIYVQGGVYAADKVRALYLLEEGVEAVRFLRDEGYTTRITPLVGTGAYYLIPSNGGWFVSATNTAPIFGTYTRTVTVESVYRRTADDDIVPSTSVDPKSIDPKTARIIIAITWPKGSINTTTYVSDIYEN